MPSRHPRPRPRRLALEPLEGRDVPSFAAPRFIDAGAIGSLLAADVNGNGKDDLITLGGGLRVFFDNGSVGPVFGGFVPTALAAGDFTGDRKLDLAALDPNGNFVLLRGDGAGGFTAGDPLTVSISNPDTGEVQFGTPYGLAAGRVDGDGNRDVVLTGSGSAGVQFLLGDGQGGFSQRGLTVADVVSVPLFTDLNADGVDDLAVVTGGFDPNTGTTSYRLAVHPGDGSGGFGTLIGSPFDLPTFGSLLAGNFIGDGATDLAVAAGGTVYVFRGSGSGGQATLALSQTLTVDTNGFPGGAVALDYGGNGYDGLVVSAYNNNWEAWIVTYRGSATGLAGGDRTDPVNNFANGLATGDFNGDRVPDVALSTRGGGVFTPPRADGIYVFQNRDAPPPRADGLTFRSPTRVTFTDVDGDAVTVTSSVPLFSAATLPDVFNLTPDSRTHRQQLQRINLAALPDPSKAAKAVITVSAQRNKAAGGDGRMNVGSVNGFNGQTGVDLYGLVVRGDLGLIGVGDTDTSTLGLGRLEVGSMGVFGTSTQAAPGAVGGIILGRVGSITVSGDVVNANLVVTGSTVSAERPADGTIGSLRITGSLVGGDADNSGFIQATGEIGRVYVGGNVVGGQGNNSARISAGGDVASVRVVGSIFGGGGEKSGFVGADGTIKEVTIGQGALGGLIQGGSGKTSGGVAADGDLKAVTVNRILGGTGEASGAVSAGGGLHNLQVRYDVVGGDGALSGLVEGGAIGTVRVGVGVLGNRGDGSGSVLSHAGIFDLKVGALAGGAGLKSGHIEAVGRIETLRVVNGVAGGAGEQSGVVTADTIGTFTTTTGGISGGSGEYSGRVTAKAMKQATIANGVVGGTKLGSGRLDVDGFLEKLTVANVYGGAGDASGVVQAGTLGTVTVLHNVEGGAGNTSGAVVSETDFTQITVNGNLFGGSGPYSGRIASVGGGIDKVSILGMVVAGTGGRSGNVSAVRVGELRVGNGMYANPDLEAGMLESDFIPATLTAQPRPKGAPTPKPQAGGTPLPAGYQASASGKALVKAGTQVFPQTGDPISKNGVWAISRGGGS